MLHTMSVKIQIFNFYDLILLHTYLYRQVRSRHFRRVFQPSPLCSPPSNLHRVCFLSIQSIYKPMRRTDLL